VGRTEPRGCSCGSRSGACARTELAERRPGRGDGIPATDVSVRVLAMGAGPGDQIRVEVKVRMPAIAMPGLAGVAAWTYSTVASLRVDDYRSR
jgi:hypothetical protein